MGKFRQLVRSAVGSAHVNRVFFDAVAIPTTGTTEFRILTSDDDPNYDQAANGTTPAECQPFSRIQNIKLRGIITAPNGNTLDFTLVKNPDAALSGANMAFAELFGADITSTRALLRKYTLMAGRMRISSASDQKAINIRIRRKALRRAGLMHDGDDLSIVITNSAGGAGTISLWGTITTVGR